MLRVLLLDDEPVILNDLALMLRHDPRIEIAGIYHDPLALLNDWPALQADCLFLDIEMPELSGIELAERLLADGANLEIVFTTAFNHYAAQAFEANAVDYLLKPVRPERMARTIDKLAATIRQRSDWKLEERRCRIHCFGAFEVKSGENSIRWTRSKSRELLAYLLQHEGKWLSKYKLCDEQWGDYEPERALAYLQTALYALRKNLREAGCSALQIEFAADKYRLSMEEVDWDVRQFEAAYDRFMNTGSKEAVYEALSGYRGEYLEGEDWCWSDLARESYIAKTDRLRKAIL